MACTYFFCLKIRPALKHMQIILYCTFYFSGNVNSLYDPISNMHTEVKAISKNIKRKHKKQYKCMKC